MSTSESPPPSGTPGLTIDATSPSFASATQLLSRLALHTRSASASPGVSVSPAAAASTSLGRDEFHLSTPSLSYIHSLGGTPHSRRSSTSMSGGGGDELSVSVTPSRSPARSPSHARAHSAAALRSPAWVSAHARAHSLARQIGHSPSASVSSSSLHVPLGTHPPTLMSIAAALDAEGEKTPAELEAPTPGAHTPLTTPSQASTPFSTAAAAAFAAVSSQHAPHHSISLSDSVHSFTVHGDSRPTSQMAHHEHHVHTTNPSSAATPIPFAAFTPVDTDIITPASVPAASSAATPLVVLVQTPVRRKRARHARTPTPPESRADPSATSIQLNGAESHVSTAVTPPVGEVAAAVEQQPHATPIQYAFETPLTDRTFSSTVVFDAADVGATTARRSRTQSRSRSPRAAAAFSRVGGTHRAPPVLASSLATPGVRTMPTPRWHASSTVPVSPHTLSHARRHTCRDACCTALSERATRAARAELESSPDFDPRLDACETDAGRARVAAERLRQTTISRAEQEAAVARLWKFADAHRAKMTVRRQQRLDEEVSENRSFKRMVRKDPLAAAIAAEAAKTPSPGDGDLANTVVASPAVVDTPRNADDVAAALYYRSMLVQEERDARLAKKAREMYAFRPTLDAHSRTLADTNKTRRPLTQRSLSRDGVRTDSRSNSLARDADDANKAPISSSPSDTFTFHPVINPTSVAILSRTTTNSADTGKKVDPNHVLHLAGTTLHPSPRREARMSAHKAASASLMPFTPQLRHQGPPPTRAQLSRTTKGFRYQFDENQVTMGEYFGYEPSTTHERETNEAVPTHQTEAEQVNQAAAATSIHFDGTSRRDASPSEDGSIEHEGEVASLVDAVSSTSLVDASSNHSPKSHDTASVGGTEVTPRAPNGIHSTFSSDSSPSPPSPLFVHAVENPYAFESLSEPTTPRRNDDGTRALSPPARAATPPGLSSPSPPRTSTRVRPHTAGDSPMRDTFAATEPAPLAVLSPVRRAQALLQDRADALSLVRGTSDLRLHHVGLLSDEDPSSARLNFHLLAARGPASPMSIMAIGGTTTERPQSLTRLTCRSSVSPYRRTHSIVPPTTFVSSHIPERLETWADGRADRRADERMVKREESLAECTFTPTINPPRRSNSQATRPSKIARAETLAADMQLDREIASELAKQESSGAATRPEVLVAAHAQKWASLSTPVAPEIAAIGSHLERQTRARERRAREAAILAGPRPLAAPSSSRGLAHTQPLASMVFSPSRSYSDLHATVTDAEVAAMPTLLPVRRSRSKKKARRVAAKPVTETPVIEPVQLSPTVTLRVDVEPEPLEDEPVPTVAIPFHLPASEAFSQPPLSPTHVLTDTRPFGLFGGALSTTPGGVGLSASAAAFTPSSSVASSEHPLLVRSLEQLAARLDALARARGSPMPPSTNVIKGRPAAQRSPVYTPHAASDIGVLTPHTTLQQLSQLNLDSPRSFSAANSPRGLAVRVPLTPLIALAHMPTSPLLRSAGASPRALHHSASPRNNSRSAFVYPMTTPPPPAAHSPTMSPVSPHSLGFDAQPRRLSGSAFSGSTTVLPPVSEDGTVSSPLTLGERSALLRASLAAVVGGLPDLGGLLARSLAREKAAGVITTTTTTIDAVAIPTDAVSPVHPTPFDSPSPSESAAPTPTTHALPGDSSHPSASSTSSRLPLPSSSALDFASPWPILSPRAVQPATAHATARTAAPTLREETDEDATDTLTSDIDASEMDD